MARRRTPGRASWWRTASADGKLGAVTAVVVTVLGVALTAVVGLILTADREPAGGLGASPPDPQTTGSADPSGAAGSPEPGPDGPDLRYTVDFPPVVRGCGSHWIAPGPVTDGARFDPDTPPPGGALTAGSSLGIVVQEVTGRTVVLHSLRARVVQRSEPNPGVRLHDGGCGGGLAQHYLAVDLDREGATAVVRTGREAGGVVVTASPFPWTTNEKEPVGYSIVLDIAKSQARFVLVLDWTWGDQRYETVIDNGGEPFVVSSVQQVSTMCTGPDGGWYSTHRIPGCAR